MAVEFFDTAMPLSQETPGLMTGLEGMADARDGLTLDKALKDAGLAERAAEPGGRTALERGDATANDLWVNLRGGGGGGGGKPSSTDGGSTIADSPEQNVVVTGRRYTFNPSAGGFQMNNDHWPYNSEQPTPPEHEPTPPDLECMDTSYLTPEELLDYKIAEIAAKIAREILDRPDHNMIEYGAMIYMDSEGVLRHTPIAAGTTWQAGMDMTGVNHSQIYGMVHSHPSHIYSDTAYNFRLFPTPDQVQANGQGDWAAYDARVDLMINALTQQGASAFEIEQRHLQFRQYVLGYGRSDPYVAPEYQLRGYDRSDRDTVTLGQKVSLNLGLCGG
jgi:hypothetical protein